MQNFFLLSWESGHCINCRVSDCVPSGGRAGGPELLTRERRCMISYDELNITWRSRANPLVGSAAAGHARCAAARVPACAAAVRSVPVCGGQQGGGGPPLIQASRRLLNLCEPAIYSRQRRRLRRPAGHRDARQSRRGAAAASACAGCGSCGRARPWSGWRRRWSSIPCDISAVRVTAGSAGSVGRCNCRRARYGRWRAFELGKLDALIQTVRNMPLAARIPRRWTRPGCRAARTSRRCCAR